VANEGPLSGKTISRYKVGEILGQGGMALVYEGQQTNIRRQVAIKVLPTHMAQNETFVTRFEREVQTIANLQHPRVLPVYDFGEFEGHLYIIMAFMAGGTLDDLIEKGPLSLEDTAYYINQVAEGLDYAHRRGIIHRDLKPANILLDADGNAHLSDFGIARLTASTTALTGSNVIGTPTYMAPEMFDGDEITGAVDIYALGVTLYEMLTGEGPFTGETPMQVMMSHLQHAVPDVHLTRQDLPPTVSWVIQRAMAKDPSERYETAIDLADDLQKTLKDEPFNQLTGGTEAFPVDATELLPSFESQQSTRQGQYTPSRNTPESLPAITRQPAVTPPEHTGRRRRRRRRGSLLGAIMIVLLSILFIGVGVIWLFAPELPEQFLFGTEPTAPPNAVVEAAAPQPTRTPRPTEEPSPTVNQAAGVTPTTGPTAAPDPVQLATNGVSTNAAWTPVIENISGYEMALVPTGCFTMGDAGGFSAEKPISEQCVTVPFWIDTTEITNQQYGITLGFPGANVPVSNVDWRDAQGFCEARGGRLPTEVEWEFAARGPDSLKYPWGNNFDGENIIYDANSGSQPGNAGSREGGVSWVGAYDLSGNVWEWVSSTYRVYPYDSGNSLWEQQNDLSVSRSMRGGSYSQDAYGNRVSVRKGLNPGAKDGDIGFRCAVDVE